MALHPASDIRRSTEGQLTPPPTRREPRHFSDEDKQAALRLAATIGLRPASRELRLSHSLLHKWKKEFPKLWSDLRKGNVEEFQQNFATRVEDIADEYVAAEQLAVREAVKRLKGGQTVFDREGNREDEVPLDAKEIAALIKAMSSARAVAVVNARALRGEPDEIHQHNISFPAIEAAMEELLNRAEQPPAIDAEVVSERRILENSTVSHRNA
jgi:transposase-like protein